MRPGLERRRLSLWPGKKERGPRALNGGGSSGFCLTCCSQAPRSCGWGAGGAAPALPFGPGNPDPSAPLLRPGGAGPQPLLLDPGSRTPPPSSQTLPEPQPFLPSDPGESGPQGGPSPTQNCSPRRMPTQPHRPPAARSEGLVGQVCVGPGPEPLRPAASLPPDTCLPQLGLNSPSLPPPTPKAGQAQKTFVAWTCRDAATEGGTEERRALPRRHQACGAQGRGVALAGLSAPTSGRHAAGESALLRGSAGRTPHYPRIHLGLPNLPFRFGYASSPLPRSSRKPDLTL